MIRAMVLTDIHFQKITSSFETWAFILLFISKLKICSVRPAEKTGVRDKIEIETLKHVLLIMRRTLVERILNLSKLKTSIAERPGFIVFE